MINSLVLTKTILDIGNSQNFNNYEAVILEKEQIKKETSQIIEKIFSICNGDLRKAIAVVIVSFCAVFITTLFSNLYLENNS